MFLNRRTCIGDYDCIGRLRCGDCARVYGLGGPLPGMKEATTAFESTRGAAVEITADPAPHWMDKAKAEADLVFGGSEVM